MIQQMPVENIIIQERIRTGASDLDDLKKSIAAVGLIQPVILTNDNVLISGFRRLNACKELGWTHIPVIVYDRPEKPAAYFDMEFHENIGRKALTDEEVFFYRQEREKRLASIKKRHKVLKIFADIWKMLINLVNKIKRK